MYYSLNDYLPYIDDKCTRMLVYSDSMFGAKLVAEYKEHHIIIVEVYDLYCFLYNRIPSPNDVITAMLKYMRENKDIVLFVGLDAYIEFLTCQDRKDFFIGMVGIIDSQQYNAHFLVSRNSLESVLFANPKYEDAMQLVNFKDNGAIDEVSITIIPDQWSSNYEGVYSFWKTLQNIGSYIPTGKYLCWMDEKNIPSLSYGHVSVIRTPKEAMEMLYGTSLSADTDQLDFLLRECNIEKSRPTELLNIHFDGEKYFSYAKAPARLVELRDDRLWKLYLWWLKSKIKENTYLWWVLQRDLTADNFLEQYIVNVAKELMNHANAKAFSEERAEAIAHLRMVDPLIAKFVVDTEEDIASIPFLNCGTAVEMQGLIRRAARYDLQYGLPDIFRTVAPALIFYLSPQFDYANKRLTEYFTRLRCYRVKNTIDDTFVKDALEFKVPSEIKRRDQIIGAYDDGDTALLVVDGLGAEYYPLLLGMAKANNLKIREKRIVSVNLPTSTEYNPIKWDEKHRLQDVKRVDDISHDGYSKHEKCAYEENLAELFILFQRTILTRVVAGLNSHKRVVVTADHGSSYLAVTAYQKGKVRTIPWSNPQDWRYTSASKAVEAPDGVEAVYRPSDGLTYYVVRGYNRLPKPGGKRYGLHGGATLEERLVPFVVFCLDPIDSETPEETVQQFEENDEFDIF